MDTFDLTATVLGVRADLTSAEPSARERAEEVLAALIATALASSSNQALG